MLDFMRRQHKKLKWVWVVIIVVLGGGMVVAYIPFSDLGSISITGNDVAKVGSETVTAVEFKNTYQNYVRNMQQQLTPEIRKAFGFDKQILDYLISQKVVMSEGKRLGLSVSDSEVQQAIYSNTAFSSRPALPSPKNVLKLCSSAAMIGASTPSTPAPDSTIRPNVNPRPIATLT